MTKQEKPEGRREGMRRIGKESAKRIRQDIRNSKHGLLKILALESLPVVMGTILSGTGRIFGEPFEIVLPATPIAMDLMHNCEGYSTKEGAWMLTKYAIGVALPYADKIYLATAPLIDKF